MSHKALEAKAPVGLLDPCAPLNTSLAIGPFSPLVAKRMKSSDHRLEQTLVDGQMLFIPTVEGWGALWSDPTLDDHPLPTIDLLKSKVGRNAKYQEIRSALGIAHGRVMFYELLDRCGEFFRVFVEAVICEHCGFKADVSATPGVNECYMGCQDETAAMRRGFSLPNQHCLACGKELNRRYTVWQISLPR